MTPIAPWPPSSSPQRAPAGTGAQRSPLQLLALPLELIHLICSHANDVRTLCAVEQTCHLLRSLPDRVWATAYQRVHPLAASLYPPRTRKECLERARKRHGWEDAHRRPLVVTQRMITTEDDGDGDHDRDRDTSGVLPYAAFTERDLVLGYGGQDWKSFDREFAFSRNIDEREGEVVGRDGDAHVEGGHGRRARGRATCKAYTTLDHVQLRTPRTSTANTTSTKMGYIFIASNCGRWYATTTARDYLAQVKWVVVYEREDGASGARSVATEATSTTSTTTATTLITPPTTPRRKRQRSAIPPRSRVILRIELNLQIYTSAFLPPSTGVRALFPGDQGRYGHTLLVMFGYRPRDGDGVRVLEVMVVDCTAGEVVGGRSRPLLDATPLMEAAVDIPTSNITAVGYNALIDPRHVIIAMVSGDLHRVDIMAGRIVATARWSGNDVELCCMHVISMEVLMVGGPHQDVFTLVRWIDRGRAAIENDDKDDGVLQCDLETLLVVDLRRPSTSHRWNARGIPFTGGHILRSIHAIDDPPPCNSSTVAVLLNDDEDDGVLRAEDGFVPSAWLQFYVDFPFFYCGMGDGAVFAVDMEVEQGDNYSNSNNTNSTAHCFVLVPDTAVAPLETLSEIGLVGGSLVSVYTEGLVTWLPLYECVGDEGDVAPYRGTGRCVKDRLLCGSDGWQRPSYPFRLE